MGSAGHWSWRVVAASVVSLLTVGVVPAAAATLTVNTTSDETVAGDHTCSLREAIAAVDSPAAHTDCRAAGFGPNTIVLGPHRYRLTITGAGGGDATGDLNVAGTVTSLTIVGAGESATVIDATGLGDRVLQIASGATVTVDALTLTGGHAPDGAPGAPGAYSACCTGGQGGLGGDGAGGGGIENDGTLTLNRVSVSGNRAGAGGAGGHGGEGVAGGPGGDAGGPGGGGGILNTGTLTINDSTIAANRAGNGGAGGAGGFGNEEAGGAGGVAGPGGDGGGIANSGVLRVVRSTISGNRAGAGGQGAKGGDGTFLSGAAGGPGNAGGSGGGIVDFGGSLTLSDATIAANLAGNGGNGGNGGNSAQDLSGSGGDGSDGGVGGGFYSFGGTDSFTNGTVVGNAAGAAGAGGTGGTGPAGPGGSGAGGSDGSGGGAYDANSSSPLTLRNTIVASNASGNCAGGGVTDGGHNLSFPDTTCPGINRDPKLGALQDNGGPAKTIVLERGSAAINQVPASGAGCPATDERGVKRPQGSACDIGAFEFATPTIAVTAPTSGAHYLRGQRVLAAFICREGAITSPIATCRGTVADGKPINTSTPGTKSFTVTATDKSGNTTSRTVHYTVTS